MTLRNGDIPTADAFNAILTGAQTSASAAAASLVDLKNRFQGAKASDPTTRSDGTALQVGDSYFNSTSNLWKAYNSGGTWQASDINTANLAASGGAALVGFLQAGASAVARTAQSKARDTISVFDFMSAAQISDVQAGTLTQNVTLVLYNAAQAIQTNGGGTLYFPPGKYLVGLQTLGGTLLDGVTPCAYGPHEIITIKNCTKAVRLVGHGAVIKAADGLHYGSFDRTTGLIYNPPAGGFYDYNYYSYPYRGMINVEGNDSVTIEGFELDGNNTKLNLGGYFGDSYWQVEGHGIWDRNNKSVVVRNVYSHHQPSDGASIGYSGLTDASLPTPHLYENFRSRYNGRLGMSLVGGIQITLINPDLSNTGQATNTVSNQPMQSTPGSGLDIEAESSVVRDVLVLNPHIIGNWTKGVTAASGDSRRVSFRGGKIEGIVGDRSHYTFDRVTFIGFTNFALASTDPYLGTTITEKDGFRFNACHFTYDPAYTESGTLVNSSQSNWAEALYSRWRDCIIDSGSQLLPTAFKSPLAADSMVWENCTWRSSNTGGHGCTGFFRGINTFLLSGVGATLATLFGTASQIDYGVITLNGANIGGGSTAQGTNKSTGVTLNANRGKITMTSDAIAAGAVASFTLTCSAIGANDTVIVQRKSGGTAGAYRVWCDSSAAGSCVICVENRTAGSLAETLVLEYEVRPGAVG